jgi:hypothetical protein
VLRLSHLGSPYPLIGVAQTKIVKTRLANGVREARHQSLSSE